jgi:hypothetical protein
MEIAWHSPAGLIMMGTSPTQQRVIEMQPMFIELKENSGATLVINVDTIHYLRAVTDNATEIHFGTGHPITVQHSLRDVTSRMGSYFAPSGRR